jgi:hypothetical protein
MRKLVSSLLLVFVPLVAGCGDKAPTSPSQESSVPGIPTGVSTSVAIATATITVTWVSVPGAVRYQVELGTSPGATTVIHEVSSITDSFPGLAIGKYYVRVKAANATGTSNASAESTAVIIDRTLAEYIDGVLLGFGRFNPGRVADCPAETPQHAWTSFARGTTVRVRIGQSVPPTAVDAITRLVNQVSEATGGNIGATVETSPDAEPLPRTGEVTIAAVPDVQAKGCSAGAAGCVVYQWAPPRPTFGLVLSAIAYGRTGSSPQTFVHEVGHALYGLCHVLGGQFAAGEGSLMASGGAAPAPMLTRLDIAALQAAYSSSLSPAAVRADFVRVGLVNP